MTEVNFLVKKGLTVPKGSAATPAIIFDAADTDCGLFSPAANQVAISVQGSASAPALSFGSDSNTGLYSPGADQVAISTNGTGRLFVDASGKITSSSAWTSDAAGQLVINNTTNLSSNQTTEYANIELRRDGVGGVYNPVSAWLSVYQYSTDGNANSALAVSTRPAGSGSQAKVIDIRHTGISFFTGAQGSSTTTERMRLTSAGLLGLGTSSPQELLDIDADGDSYLRWERDGAAGGYDTSGGVLRIGPYFAATNRELALYSDNSNDSWVTTGTAENLYLGTNKTARLAIGANGNVTIAAGNNLGIGTTSPSSLLHLADAGNITVGTTTGTKIGTATSQKIGFYNATPVVQPTTGVAEAAFVENSGGTAVNVDSTFGGYTIQQVVQALQTLGLLA
jgi:hypothetical protein